MTRILTFPDQTRLAFVFKSSNAWKPHYSKGLHDVLERKWVKRAFGVYAGGRPLRDGKIEVYPVKEFCSLLARNQLF